MSQHVAPKSEHWRPWLEALHIGDCLAVRKLLRVNPWFIVVFPGSNDCNFEIARKLLSEDHDDEALRDWEGCSALHVAVRQGCLELVSEIFDIFLVHDTVSGANGADDHGQGTHGLDDSSSGGSYIGESKALSMKKPPLTKEMHVMENLLLAFDPKTGLDALAMAVINGEEDMVRILVSAFSKFENNPYNIAIEGSEAAAALDMGIDGELRGAEAISDVRQIADEVLREIGDEADLAEKEFSRLHEFNFLPWPQYLFHAACSHRSTALDKCRRKMLESALRSSRRSVDYLFSLHDGQGRTPLHIAMEAGVDLGIVQEIYNIIPEGEEYIEALNSRDAAGRTVLHCAIAKEHADREVEQLLRDERIDVNASFSYNSKIMGYFDVEKLCSRHGYKNSSSILKNFYKSTVLHMALWSPWPKVVKAVQILLKDPRLNLSQTCTCSIVSRHDRIDPSPFGWNKDNDFYLTPLQLATLTESAPILQLLANDDRAYDSARLENLTSFDDLRRSVETEIHSLMSGHPNLSFKSESSKGRFSQFKSKRLETWDRFMNTSALHYAAAIGSPAAVRIILNSKKFDPLVEDAEGNNALHYAAYARDSTPVVQPHILDIVSCHSSVVHKIQATSESEGGTRTGESRRQGCINLLLQAGIDMWKINKEGNIADPGIRASPEACSWWYEKLARETLETKQSLNAAANAVSVTAALVATASYVGPMQPPLGYGTTPDGNSEQVQVEFLSVRMFIVCDTLAFYVALCAIMLSLIPSLPMPHESMLDELVSTRRAVTLAVAFLILSIVSIVFAFASASISVIPNGLGRSYGGLTLGPIVVGWFSCILIMYMVILRLIRLILHKNFWFRRNYRRMTLF